MHDTVAQKLHMHDALYFIRLQLYTTQARRAQEQRRSHDMACGSFKRNGLTCLKQARAGTEATNTWMRWATQWPFVTVGQLIIISEHRSVIFVHDVHFWEVPEIFMHLDVLGN